MPRLETAGTKRFWPMKELVGRREDGSKITSEVFVDMASEDHKVYRSIDKDGIDHGWSGNPNLPASGRCKDGITLYSARYTANYDSIKWEKYDGKKLDQGRDQTTGSVA